MEWRNTKKEKIVWANIWQGHMSTKVYHQDTPSGKLKENEDQPWFGFRPALGGGFKSTFRRECPIKSFGYRRRLGCSAIVGTPQTGRLLNGAFGPSRNSIRRSLGVCHTDIASHRHVLGGFVKTSTTIAIFESAIRTDLDSLITPFLPQSRTSLEMQHRWQTRGCSLHCNDAVDEDEGDTPAL